MEKISFEQLPAAVALLLEKITCIEMLLENLPHNQQDTVSMLTITEAAAFLDVSVASLYTRVSRREIPVYKPGRRLYFNQQELLDWMMASRRKTGPEIGKDAEQHMAALTHKRKARRF